jgi:hypothetical protein
MLDLSNLPTNQKVDQQIFNANSATAGAGWATWVKPRGVNFVHIFALGGGGGGGAGDTTGSGGGGGGGGSSAQGLLLFPAWRLPDTLSISVGYGGAGGASLTSGAAGIASYISIYPSATVNYILAIVNGGGGGTYVNSGGAGGAGGTSATIATACLGALGHSYSVTAGNVTSVGQAGSGSQTSVTFPVTGLLVTGGAGGGLCSAATNTAGTAGGL